MSHCSEPRADGEMADFLRAFRGDSPKPHPRQFPEGRIDPTDDGLCKMAVATQKQRVIIAFDRPMDWVGMTAEQASALADLLTAAALKARGID